jgi:hypothetical protein
MAFRIKTTTAAIGLMTMLAGFAAAHDLSFAVRHRHLRKGGPGELRFTESSVIFRESGKHQNHSREWKYQDIQQLWLAPADLRIRTYEDVGWKLGMDRSYEFDHLPKDVATRLYSLLRGRMDQRFVAALPDPNIQPLWQVPAKQLSRLGGSEGVVLIGSNAIVYNSDETDASRTWRFQDIDNISSAGPFNLSVTTFELDNGSHGGRRTFRFQLKKPLPESQYNSLWQRLNQAALAADSRKDTNND